MMKKGWKTENLGDLCRIRTGKKDVNQGNPAGISPFFTCAAEHTFSDSYSFDTEALLIAGNGDVGKVSYYKGKFEAYQRTYVLSDFDKISSRFLFHILDGKLRDTVSKQKLGNTMPYIKVGMLTDFQLPVPPLPEQHRIVGLLDEAFEGIATAKANAAKNLQNARALFESHLQSVFSQRGKGWVETTLGEAYDVRDGTHDSPKYHATGYPLITSKNLKRDGLSFENIKLISEKDFREINKRSAVHKGDVLFAMIGTIGNPTLVEVEPKFAIKNVALLKVSQHQSGAFLRHYLGSSLVIDKMTREAKGTTQRFVGLGYLHGFPIQLPPLKAQLEVVQELDALSSKTQRLTSLYTRKLAALEALKKSLLHLAFSGEL
jgi:type I restriction enzyme, S subunit